mgnify:CR=1 FL=1|jgi:uncharacterized protein (TIGR02300 family)
MIKASWGIKRTCPCGNGVRFYDLNKKEIECPSCGENINVEQLLISTLENNLRKKSQTELAELNEEKKKISKKNKDSTKNEEPPIEIDTEDDPKTEVKDIIGDNLDKDKRKEE